MHILKIIAAVLQVSILAGVPLLTLAFLLVFPWLALRALRQLLSGLLDLTSLQAIAVTITACLTSWSAMIACWLVYSYSPLRMTVLWATPLTRSPILFLATVFIFAFATLPLTVSALVYSTAQEIPERRRRKKRMLIVGTLLGYGFAGILAGLCYFAYCNLSRVLPALHPPFLAHLDFWRGYLQPCTNKLLHGHILAFVAWLITSIVYVSLGLAHRWRLRLSRDLPSLCYVLLVAALVCWSLSGLSFFFQVYRVPIILLLVVWLALTAHFSTTDFYYKALPGGQVPPAPAEILDASLVDSIILVAATGGGIQSSAWTVKVLTELQRAWVKQNPENTSRFSQALRAISSVSGGSIGAMFFAAAYDPSGNLPSADYDLDAIQQTAATSTLNDIAWGLCYGDLLRTISVYSWKFFADRGRVFETALARLNDKVVSGLSTWQTAVKQGLRPANLFNSTIVETGDRLLIATSQFSSPPEACSQFYSLYPGSDLAAVTAARLSAGFPYVAPAARSDLGGAATPQFHVVDGGYYDNYGMVTLSQWLQSALEDTNLKSKRFLVLQLRGFPPNPPQTAARKRGWLYQLLAPPEAVYNSRTCAQIAHNDMEFELLAVACNNIGIFIDTRVFQYNGDHAPPLSWHLTPIQIKSLDDAWLSQKNQESAEVVLEFLRK